MLLQFVHKHLSIDQFDPIDLDQLTIITGINGSGKTRLLSAIMSGAVLVGNIQKYAITRFDYENFKLDNESVQTGHQITSSKEQVWAQLQSLVNQTQHLRPSFQNLPAGLDAARTSPFWNDKKHPAMEQYRITVSGYLNQAHFQDQPWAAQLLNYFKSTDRPIFECSKQDFIDEFRPFTYKNDFLPQEIGAVIWDYYLRWMQNKIAKLQFDSGHTSYQFLNEEEFVKKNGEKPWDTINRILRGFGTLDFEISSPEGLDVFGGFNLQLIHTSKPDLKLSFSNLSSGERILMALVASVYKYASENSFPELLLLDELDATLHPSMIKTMISVFHETFISRGTHIILVSHSPTTVALSSDQHVVLMEKSGKERFVKVGRDKALSVLTEGFATLEEGMLLFEQIAGNRLLVMSEGRNRHFLEKLFTLHDLQGVRLVEGLESISGQTQLKTLYDFMLKIPHKSMVLFVWDCDVKYRPQENPNTSYFVLPHNPNNNIAKKGIENMFPPELFASFQKRIELSRGFVKVEFDESRKSDFETFILDRSLAADFENFMPLVDRVRKLVGKTSDA